MDSEYTELGEKKQQVSYLEKLKQHKIKLIVLLTIILFLFVFAATFTISFLFGYLVAVDSPQNKYVYYFPNTDRMNRDDPLEKNLLQTKEYQVRISKTRYADRMDSVRALTQYLRTLTGLKLDENDAKIEIYRETQYSTSECGHQFSELRQRIFYDENGDIIEDKTTIDINEDSNPTDDIHTATAWDLAAADHYKSEEKIEQDIHSSHYKYNRKTKVKNLPTKFKLKTCGDIEEMFPYAFGVPIDGDKKLHGLGTVYYVWEYSFSGYMFFDSVKFKFAWTLYYTSLENALDYQLAPEHQPEFSIRVYSPGDGMAPWYKEALEYSADIFVKVLAFES